MLEDVSSILEDVYGILEDVVSFISVFAGGVRPEGHYYTTW